MADVILRPGRSSDCLQIAAIYRVYVETTPISFETEAPSADEMARRMQALSPLYPYLVAERGDDILGYAYAGAFRTRAAYQWSAETTVYLAPSAHRQGLGRRLYCHLLEILKEQGFHGAFAGITLPNVASTGLHESLGFRQVGQYPRAGYKLGHWHDVGTWYLELNPPHPVHPLATAHDLNLFLNPVRLEQLF